MELKRNEFGYVGIHYDVELKNQEDGLKGLRCEIQLHTRAQNMWADAEHDLLYKFVGEVGEESERSLYRLMALVEVFDSELQRVIDVANSDPGRYVSAMIGELERRFYTLTAGREYNAELSRVVVAVVKEAYVADEFPNFNDIISEFVRINVTKLEHIYQQYRRDHRCATLLYQPEALMIFERMDANPLILREVWDYKLDAELLTALADVWAADV